MCAVSRYVTDILSIRSDPSIRISFTISYPKYPMPKTAYSIAKFHSVYAPFVLLRTLWMLDSNGYNNGSERVEEYLSGLLIGGSGEAGVWTRSGESIMVFVNSV